ncbi:terminase small subunit [Sulfurimonas marina]|uniref:Terminase small subunit n=1 Tax=Sulfurimonas marina TaxID=2590551 RepID=A0A7M1AXF4_9BACT|nr:terminase small subunit [Sulfurimonas marina]QOP41052.1 hypothetical protein FJR03_04575 [Sulfurimonas marina]
MNKALTKMQQDFVEVYVVTRNAKKSALQAGYSPTFAEKKSYGLLNDSKIKTAIAEAEKHYFSEKFKKLSALATEELENILINGNNKEKLRASEIIFKSSRLADMLIKQEDETEKPITITVSLPPELEGDIG